MLLQEQMPNSICLCLPRRADRDPVHDLRPSIKHNLPRKSGRDQQLRLNLPRPPRPRPDGPIKSRKLPSLPFSRQLRNQPKQSSLGCLHLQRRPPSLQRGARRRQGIGGSRAHGEGGCAQRRLR